MLSLMRSSNCVLTKFNSIICWSIPLSLFKGNILYNVLLVCSLKNPKCASIVLKSQNIKHVKTLWRGLKAEWPYSGKGLQELGAEGKGNRQSRYWKTERRWQRASEASSSSSFLRAFSIMFIFFALKHYGLESPSISWVFQVDFEKRTVSTLFTQLKI